MWFKFQIMKISCAPLQVMKRVRENLLPFDGLVYYTAKVFEPGEADRYMDVLLRSVDWKHDELMMFGKKVVTKRKVAWYGDAGLAYQYSGVRKMAKTWTPELLALKRMAEKITGSTYNSCLLNLYHNGKESMSWHSDNEKELRRHGSIASLSFGAVRTFLFRHRQTRKSIPVLLEHGSLLEMKGEVQDFWQHRLPPSARVHDPRVNLTFRTILG